MLEEAKIVVLPVDKNYDQIMRKLGEAFSRNAPLPDLDPEELAAIRRESDALEALGSSVGEEVAIALGSVISLYAKRGISFMLLVKFPNDTPREVLEAYFPQSGIERAEFVDLLDWGRNLLVFPLATL